MLAGLFHHLYLRYNMIIRNANEKDINEWMKLVKTVRDSFPGLETGQALKEHEKTVFRFMKNEEAAAAFEGQKLIGAVLYSKEHNMICFLAVDPERRRKGVASALLNFALEKLDEKRDVIVSTYRGDDEKGTAARELYIKFGFQPEKMILEFGYPCQVFRLHSKSCGVQGRIDDASECKS